MNCTGRRTRQRRGRRGAARARLVLFATGLVGAVPGGRALAAAPSAGSGQPAEGRDPFRAPTASGPAERPPGLAGVRIVEAVVRGILRTAGGDRAAAILESPAGEGAVAKPGTALFDGSLLRVEADGAVFLTDHDPPREFFRPLAEPPGSESARASRETTSRETTSRETGEPGGAPP